MLRMGRPRLSTQLGGGSKRLAASVRENRRDCQDSRGDKFARAKNYAAGPPGYVFGRVTR